MAEVFNFSTNGKKKGYRSLSYKKIHKRPKNTQFLDIFGEIFSGPVTSFLTFLHNRL